MEVFVCASYAQLLDFGTEHVHLGLNGIYDAANRTLASAGPLPLASDEEWVESDEAFTKRIYGFAQVRPSGRIVGELLDACGEGLGLPRARLVPATTKEGM